MSTPKYLTDIDKTVEGLPFGALDVKITRHRSKVTKVVYRKDSRIEPKSNKEAFFDLETFINSLIGAFFSGKVEFTVEFKGGTITMITIKNKETKNYGQTSAQST